MFAFPTNQPAKEGHQAHIYEGARTPFAKPPLGISSGVTTADLPRDAIGGLAGAISSAHCDPNVPLFKVHSHKIINDGSGNINNPQALCDWPSDPCRFHCVEHDDVMRYFHEPLRNSFGEPSAYCVPPFNMTTKQMVQVRLLIHHLRRISACPVAEDSAALPALKPGTTVTIHSCVELALRCNPTGAPVPCISPPFQKDIAKEMLYWMSPPQRKNNSSGPMASPARQDGRDLADRDASRAPVNGPCLQGTATGLDLAMDSKAFNHQLRQPLMAQRAFPMPPLEGAPPPRPLNARVMITGQSNPSSESYLFDARHPVHCLIATAIQDQSEDEHHPGFDNADFARAGADAQTSTTSGRARFAPEGGAMQVGNPAACTPSARSVSTRRPPLRQLYTSGQSSASYPLFPDN
ncbi:unnamed protein product [Prorocentrum cordatum]|uniref:PNPLA domain-containing protein n=1 Tax=Prorocentrum cordatum TaxID=2364126 RepID=A0ABN9U5F4_9DINO|nr:unnamed protein product [Polarella glacialis]